MLSQKENIPERNRITRCGFQSHLNRTIYEVQLKVTPGIYKQKSCFKKTTVKRKHKCQSDS